MGEALARRALQGVGESDPAIEGAVQRWRVPGSRDPGEVLTERDPADPRTDVEQEVCDHQRPGSAPPQEHPPERHSHREVAEEPAPSLIQVIRTAQQGGLPIAPGVGTRNCCNRVIRYPATITSSSSAASAAFSTSTGTVHQ